MINLNNEILNNPYPILVQKNFLETDHYNDLLKHFPKVEDFGKPLECIANLLIQMSIIKNYYKKNVGKNYIIIFILRTLLIKYLKLFQNELNTQQDLLFDINNFEFVLEYEGRNIKKNMI